MGLVDEQVLDGDEVRRLAFCQQLHDYLAERFRRYFHGE